MNDNNYDVMQSFPPVQEGKILTQGNYSCFGLSLQGSSHIRKNTPCQDFNEFRFVKEAGIILACIADGVGSCDLSHWGAYVAVTSALDFSEKEIKKIAWEKKLGWKDEIVSEILRNAFLYAVDAVESIADFHQKMPFVFQSTLTLMVYDGSKVYCQHAGDDGVIVQFKDGCVEMITERKKGEEANSVFPLQSGEKYWQFSKAGDDQRGPVVAVIMATDGVLDSFVLDDNEFKTVPGCCNGIYYPFMKPSVYYPGRRSDLNRFGDVEHALSYYINRMNKEEYRKKVTDDLTLLSIINDQEILSSREPFFDKEVFAEICTDIRERKRAALYPSLSAEQKKSQYSDSVRERINNDKTDDYPNNDNSTKEVTKKRRPIVYIVALLVLIIGLGFGTVASKFLLKRKNQDSESRVPVRTEEKQNTEEQNQNERQGGEAGISNQEKDYSGKQDDTVEQKAEKKKNNAINEENMQNFKNGMISEMRKIDNYYIKKGVYDE